MRLIRPVTVDPSRLVYSSVPETLPEYAAGATYGEGDRVRSGTRIYESAADANTGHPLEDQAWWIDAGPTNRWAMFDDVNSTATAADGIAFTVRPGTLIDSIALIDVSASAVTVTAESDVEGEVYSRAVSLIDDGSVEDFYDWFFSPIERMTTLVLSDLPPLNDIEVTIALSGEGQQLATFVMGLSRELGVTVQGASIGIRDFSRKEKDAFGHDILVERPYSKRGSFTVWCDNAAVDGIAILLARYRATPVVWIAGGGFAATTIFGFYRDWSIEIAHPTQSICTLEIEGLT